MMHSKTSTLYIRGLLLLGSLLRFVDLGALPLTGDEAYYWLWSRNLDWAYYDHPAGVAWLIRLSTSLAGQTAFGIRWLNAVLGVLCIALLYRVGSLLLSRREGRFAATGVAVGAPYLLTARFVYTNVLFLCAMLCNLWAFWSTVTSSDQRDTSLTRPYTPRFAFGLTLAALFNTKYTAYLYVIALGFLILVDHRELLRSTNFWINVAIAALGLLPVLSWNLAHDWASIRWQVSHLVTASPGGQAGGVFVQWAGNARHASGYLTWPVLALGGFGFLQVRSSAGRLLALIAFVLLVPVGLSPANSPRNLASGLALLLLLAGQWLASPKRNRHYGLPVKWGLRALVLAAFVYGIGTLLSLGGVVSSLQSSAVREIYRDSIDGHTLAKALKPYPSPFFAIDYDLAGRIRYETGRTAVSGWGQFTVWGYPEWDRGTVLAWEYIPAPCLTGQLRMIFEQVTGPEAMQVASLDQPRTLYLWVVRDPRVATHDIASALDFLTLWYTCP